MATQFETNLTLHSTIIALRKVIKKYKREIEATEQLGLNGYYVMLGQGESATLAKLNERGQMGYFGHTFLSGSPLAVKQWVEGWNSVHTEPEHAASVAGPEKAIVWFRRSIIMMEQVIREGEAKLAEK